MKRVLTAILIIFFIFLVNTASAETKYLSVTLTQGEETSYTDAVTNNDDNYAMTAWMSATGDASSWVSPNYIDFGVIYPGTKSNRPSYTIKVPEYQSPGYYELRWRYGCKWISSDYPCSFTGDTVLQITVKAKPTPKPTEHKYVALTVTQGEELTRTSTVTGANDQSFDWADASGSAASWVTPRHLDFGTVNPGAEINRDYIIRVPENQKPGYYELIWTFGCKYTSGKTCSYSSDTVLQITLNAKSAPVFTKPIPTVTPTTESSIAIVIGFVVLILFIIWIFVAVWVARDANKRGESGTMWGIAAFFLGLIGLIIYLIARPKGRLVLCEYCRNEKLETLNRCPHCKQPAPAFIPAPTPVPAYPAYPAAPKPQEPAAKPHANELKELKEKLNKTNQLLDKLDERLVNGELTEAKYKELAGKYRAEAESLKNQIAEKELLGEVGLKDE